VKPAVLTPAQGVTLVEPDVVPDVHPESQYHIDDERRTEGKEGDIDKPEPYAGGGNTQPLAYSAAYAEGLPFDIVLKAVQRIFHEAN
jgi:hypothetical protein